MRHLITRRAAMVSSLVATFAVALPVGFAVGQGDGTSGIDPNSPESIAFEREGLTKVLAGMEHRGAPESEKADIQALLSDIGGPDPAVEPYAGPDNAGEWWAALDQYQRECDAGSPEDCSKIPKAEAELDAALQAEGLEIEDVDRK